MYCGKLSLSDAIHNAPRAQIREVAIVLMATRMKLGLSSVIAVGGPHRTYDGQFVDVACGMRKPVAHFDTAVTMFAKKPTCNG